MHTYNLWKKAIPISSYQKNDIWNCIAPISAILICWILAICFCMFLILSFDHVFLFISFSFSRKCSLKLDPGFQVVTSKKECCIWNLSMTADIAACTWFETTGRANEMIAGSWILSLLWSLFIAVHSRTFREVNCSNCDSIVWSEQDSDVLLLPQDI